MKAIIFPGQGVRFPDIMGLDLMKTINSQPTVFLYCTALALSSPIVPDIVAGHSLGEFAALVISKAISFEDGLNLVLHRASITQKVCEAQELAMGVVIGLTDHHIERRTKEISEESGEPVYIANYNGDGQVVITGTKKGIRLACEAFKNDGAKKAVPLSIGGAFHSPFMNKAGWEFAEIILATKFNKPICPVVQCADGLPHTDPDKIKSNLIKHITHPVLWTTMVHSMELFGVKEYYEASPDDTLQKIVSRITKHKVINLNKTSWI